MQDLHLQGDVTTVAPPEYCRTHKPLCTDKLIYVLSHIGIVVFLYGGIHSLTARIYGIYQISIGLQYRRRRFKVIITAPVSMQQDYRPSITLDDIEEALTIDSDCSGTTHQSSSALPDGIG